MKKLSQKEMIDKFHTTVASDSLLQLSRKETRHLYDILWDTVETALTEAGAVSTPVGIFKRIGRKGRIGRNLHTGAPIRIAPRDVIKFHPTARVKKMLRHG